MQFEYPVQCREYITPAIHDDENLNASFPILSKELIVASQSDVDRFLNYASNTKDNISMFALAQYMASEFQRGFDGIWSWIVNGVYKTPPILSRTFTFTPRAVPISVCTNETYMTINFDVVRTARAGAQAQAESQFEKTRLRSCIIFFDDEGNMCISKGKEICFEYYPSKSLFVKETPLSVRFGVRDALKKHKVSRVCLMLVPAKDSRAEWAPWISHDVPVVASSYIKRDVFARYPPWSIDPRAVYWAMSAAKPSMQFVFRCESESSSKSSNNTKKFQCVGTYNDFSGRITNGYTDEFQGTGTFLLPVTRRFMLMTRDSDQIPAHDLQTCSNEDLQRLLEDVRKRVELAFQNAPATIDEETDLLSYLEQQREFVGDGEKKKKKNSSKKRRLESTSSTSSSTTTTPTLALEGEQQKQQQQQQQELESQPESQPESTMQEQAPSDEAGA